MAEDLLRNTENLAVAIGGVLDATSDNINNSSIAINRANIGNNIKLMYNSTDVHAYIHTCIHTVHLRCNFTLTSSVLLSTSITLRHVIE